MTGKLRPRIAIWMSSIYFVLAFGSWLLPFIARAEDNMSGIFLILFAQPWASLWVWVSDQLQLDSMWLGMVVMLLGVLLNTWIIYRVFAWISRR